MAATHGRSTTGVDRFLAEHPARFSLEQALRLLELELERKGVSRAEVERHVHVVPWLSLAFPAHEIVRLRLDEGQTDEDEDEDEKDETGIDLDFLAEATSLPDAPHYRLENTLVGLYSTLGPLPTLYTEELLGEARADRSVVKDFLDIINNRIAHLHFCAERYYDYARRLVEQEDENMARMLYSLMGQAYPELHRGRPPRPQAVELLVAPRTADGLAHYLASELSWPEIWVEECVSRKAAIPGEQRCR
jgi:type VI secretion system protein ImpH